MKKSNQTADDRSNRDVIQNKHNDFDQMATNLMFKLLYKYLRPLFLKSKSSLFYLYSPKCK